MIGAGPCIRSLISAPKTLSHALASPLADQCQHLQVLYKQLASLCAEVDCDQPGPGMTRSKPGAAALCRMEERGSTLMYRMPIWLYDDDD